jgi:hypothetical protein
MRHGLDGSGASKAVSARGETISSGGLHSLGVASIQRNMSHKPRFKMMQEGIDGRPRSSKIYSK